MLGLYWDPLCWETTRDMYNLPDIQGLEYKPESWNSSILEKGEAWTRFQTET